MKYIFFATLVLTFAACRQPEGDSKVLQDRIDNLEKKLSDSYKPGLGEFMSAIQVHHAKLWFAGSSQNWRLADFEIQEIKESLDDIQKYCADRTEVKSIPMLTPAVDSVTQAILHKNNDSFKSGFVFLTNTCNSCHQSTNHEFNVIRIPDNPPFSNQVFKNEPSR
jgi:hypothetical protein